MSDEPKNPTTIERLCESAYSSMAMLAGMQLDLFTTLAAGPMTPDQLANSLNVDSARLRVLMYALSNAGLLVVDEGVFTNTGETGKYLVRSSPSYIGDRHLMWDRFWGAAMNTAETVRSGSPAALYDFASLSEREQESYFRGLHPRTVAAGEHFARSVDLSRYRRVLDLGCGSGGFSIGMAGSSNDIEITAADLPAVMGVASGFIEEAGLQDRILLKSVDITNDTINGNFDAIILKNVLQVLSPDQSRKVLANVVSSVAAEGHVYVIGDILSDDRTKPSESVALNLALINLYPNGQAYSMAEYRDWLESVGFVDVCAINEDTIRATSP